MLQIQEAHHFIRTTMRKPTEQDGCIANTDATNLKRQNKVYPFSPVEIGMRILQEPACLI
jgi:hypothetical protein